MDGLQRPLVRLSDAARLRRTRPVRYPEQFIDHCRLAPARVHVTPTVMNGQIHVGYTHLTYLHAWSFDLPVSLPQVDGFPALRVLRRLRSHEARAL